MAKWKAPEGGKLSGYEKQVLLLASKGLTNVEIARELGKTPSSVAVAITHVREKLNIGGRDLRHAILYQQSRELSRLKGLING